MALTHLHIPRPGQVPSSEKLEPGQTFTHAGDPSKDVVTDGLHIARMVRRGAIKPFRKPPAKKVSKTNG